MKYPMRYAFLSMLESPIFLQYPVKIIKYLSWFSHEISRFLPFHCPKIPKSNGFPTGSPRVTARTQAPPRRSNRPRPRRRVAPVQRRGRSRPCRLEYAAGPRNRCWIDICILYIIYYILYLISHISNLISHISQIIYYILYIIYYIVYIIYFTLNLIY